MELEGEPDLDGEAAGLAADAWAELKAMVAGSSGGLGEQQRTWARGGGAPRADLGERRAWRRRHTWSSRGRRAWRRRRSWVSGSGDGLASGFGCSVSHDREGREAALGVSLSPSGQLPRRPRR